MNTSSEGRFAMCRMPSTVSPPAVSHSGVRKETHDEIRARPLEVERVEPGLAQPPRDVVQLLRRAPPRPRQGRARRGGTRARSRPTVARGPRGLPARGRRAAPMSRVGARYDRPVDETLVDDREHLLDERQLVATRAIGIEPRKRVGRRRARERDPRGPLAAELEHPVAVPAGNEVECLRARVLDSRALRVRVEVRDIHEAGTAPVGRRRHLARHLLLAERSADRDELVLLDVRAEHDGELGESGG